MHYLMVELGGQIPKSLHSRCAHVTSPQVDIISHCAHAYNIPNTHLVCSIVHTEGGDRDMC